MSSTFDPYYKWLAIPPADQPPNHYRLLALNLFESDPDVIAVAADQRMSHVRRFQGGQYVDASQRLLNELSAARICLLRPEKKAAYDAALRAKLAQSAVPKTAPPLPCKPAGPTLDAPSLPAPVDVSYAAGPKQAAPVAIKLIDAPPASAPLANAAPMSPAPMSPSPTNALPANAPPIPSLSAEAAHEAQAAPVAIVANTRAADAMPAVAAQSSVAQSSVVRPAARAATVQLAGQSAAAPPAADWHADIDSLLLGDSAGEHRGRLAPVRSRKPIPRIVFIGPLLGVAAVIASVIYVNVRDAIQQYGANSRTTVREPARMRPPSRFPRWIRATHPDRQTPTRIQMLRRNFASGDTKNPFSFGTLQPIPQRGTAGAAPDGSLASKPGNAKTPTAVRLAVPDADAQRKKLAELKEVYKDDFAKATSIAGREALAAKLTKLAADSQGDPATRYVVAMQALELAVKLCDAKLASNLVAGLCYYYDVDSWDLKAKTLTQLSSAAKTPTARELVAHGALELVDKAVAEEHYDDAVRLATTASDLAATLRDTALRDKTHEANARAHRIQQEALQAETAQERLAEHPDDSAAHLLLGRFYCLERDDWDTGLPHLVACGDPELSAIARHDLAGAAQPVDQVTLADAWWELADQRREKADARLVKGMRNRAIYWYRRAMPQLSGFAKSKAEKRIAEAK